MQLVFSHPFYLLALVFIPIFIFIHLFTIRYTGGAALKFANFTALARAANKIVLPRNMFPLIIRSVALFCVVLAVANPTLLYEGKGSDFDYVLTIDASSSMLADDLTPTRLQAAKEAALSFLDAVPRKTNIGVISFSGTAFVEQQPTTDRLLVKEAIEKIDAQPVGGTDLGAAMVTSVNLLTNSDKAKSVILLTDGRSTVGISPRDAVAYTNDKQTIINTIGIGTEEGGRFPEAEVILKLDEATLEMIANETSGHYFKAGDNDKLKEAYKLIATSTKMKLSTNLTLPLMLISLVLLLADWGLANTKYRRIL